MRPDLLTGFNRATSWRNGNASDSRSEDWGFDSLWGHSPLTISSSETCDPKSLFWLKPITFYFDLDVFFSKKKVSQTCRSGRQTDLLVIPSPVMWCGVTRHYMKKWLQDREMSSVPTDQIGWPGFKSRRWQLSEPIVVGENELTYTVTGKGCRESDSVVSIPSRKKQSHIFDLDCFFLKKRSPRPVGRSDLLVVPSLII